MTIRNIIMAAAGGAGLPTTPQYKINSRGDTTWGGSTTAVWPAYAKIARNSTISGTSTIIGHQFYFPTIATPSEGILAGFTAANGLDFSNNPWTFKGSQTTAPVQWIVGPIDLDNSGSVYAYKTLTDLTTPNPQARVNIRATNGTTTSVIIPRPALVNTTNWASGLALSGNAQYLFVAAPSFGTVQNNIYVYFANNTTPTSITNYTLQATLSSSTSNDGINLGGDNNLQSNTDGSWFIAGADTTGAGAARVIIWSRSGASWTRRLEIFQPAGNTNWGKAVAISGDANYLAYAFESSTSSTTYVNLMSRSGTNWTFSKQFVYTGGNQWANSIAMNNDGSVLAISNYYTGSVDIYKGLGGSMQYSSTLGFQDAKSNFAITNVGINSAGNIVIASRNQDNYISVWNVT